MGCSSKALPRPGCQLSVAGSPHPQRGNAPGQWMREQAGFGRLLPSTDLIVVLDRTTSLGTDRRESQQGEGGAAVHVMSVSQFDRTAVVTHPLAEMQSELTECKKK